MVEIASALKQLESIARTLREGGAPPNPSVREFLKWFGARKRGSYIVRQIRLALQHYGLTTTPDFESSWIDGPISFALALPESRMGDHGTQTLASGTVPTSPAIPPPTPVDAVPDSLSQSESPSPGESPVNQGLPPAEPSTETTTLTTLFKVDSPVSGTWEGVFLPLKEPLTIRVRGGDPTHRISKLEAANNPPVSVKPDGTLNEAVTIMLVNDFSQVPVMPNERDVKGMVTWQSIGSRLALDREIKSAKDVMEPHVEVRSDESIFAAIAVLVRHGYVLVRGPDERIAGIVTTSDMNLQFQQLAEPFLLLSEIENRIRNIIARRFDPPELATARDPAEDEREVTSVDEMTLGEYIRLLERPEHWERAALNVDRRTFIKALQNVLRIRNDVMHFDTDGPLPEDIDALRDFAKFLQRLEMIGVTG